MFLNQLRYDFTKIAHVLDKTRSPTNTIRARCDPRLARKKAQVHWAFFVLKVRLLRSSHTVSNSNGACNERQQQLLPFHFLSHLSFAFASAFVCHCMLDGESAPPLASGIT